MKHTLESEESKGEAMVMRIDCCREKPAKS